MILWRWQEERTTLVWTWLGLLGVAVAVPIPWTGVDPIASDASAPYDGDKYVCLLDDVMYRGGDSVATATACEKCVCRPPDIVCTTILCEMKPGCRALQKSNQCCPEYHCECERDGKTYNNGEKLESPENPCEVCYCRGGVIVCALITCYTRDDCQPQEVPGRCCPKYDHCPPIDSNNIKLTTTWPLSNVSSPADESAGDVDVDANSVTVGVTSSRRLSLPGEYRVTRVPVQATSSDSTTSSSDSEVTTAETGGDTTTSQQVAFSSVSADDNAEDSVAESSEHSPVKILSLFNITDLGNETVAENQINRTLDNNVDYEDTAQGQGSEIVNVTELGDFTTSEGENSTTSGIDVEATTAVPTTETYSVIATPGILASSSRAPLTSEPWEEHRPTQMVTDDIQYVTTLDPLVSVVESIGTEATTPGVSAEAKDNVSQEVTSEISISTEKEAATTETTNSATEIKNINEETSTVFEKSLEVNYLNETEGSESESTDSSTQEPPEMLTSMEMLLNEMTAPSDADEVDNEDTNTTLAENNTTSTESATVLTTTPLEKSEPLESEDPEEDDSLPVLKLSEEMENHQMDFVIHHIVVPTESDDLEVEVEMMNPVGEVAASTEASNSTGTTSSVTTSGGDEKDETRTTLLDGDQVQISQNKIDDGEKEMNETSTVENMLNVTNVSKMEDVTNADETSESDRGQQERVILANKEDDTSTNSTEEPEVTTQQKTDERRTETPLTLQLGVSDDATKEVEASIVSTPTLESLKVEDTDIDSTEKTTTDVESSSSARTEEAEESTDLATSDVTPLTSTSASLPQEIRSNIIAEEVVEIRTNNSIDDGEEKSSNVTLSDGSPGDDNATESSPTTEDISNTTASIAEATEFDIIEDSIKFQSNKIASGQESSSLPSSTEVTVGVISEDPTSTTEERLQGNDVQNTTVIFVTDEPTEITNIVTSSLVITSEGEDNSPRPDVKRETIFLTSFPPNEENSALTPNSNSEKFAALQRKDAEEISKYDLALLQNFFKNLYIQDDHAIVAVT